ncbi:MAG: hypothetical protein IJA45_03390 [Oscillospiraceae bacterium]|nr:hypothetical protein [Oscillospiraceae bacterium]
MSTHVGKMKDVLVSFNTTALDIRKKMQNAHAQYKEDIAAAEENKLREQLKQAEATAREQIAGILQEAVAAAKQWAAPDGAKIDAADLELLRGDFNLSTEDIHGLLVKHQGNGVMVNAIAKYAKEHGITPSYIPNVEDKESAYEAFANGANNMISNIAGNLGYSADSDTLALWGQPGNMSQRLELAIFGIKDLSAAEPPKATFDFGFKPLEGR